MAHALRRHDALQVRSHPLPFSNESSRGNEPCLALARCQWGLNAAMLCTAAVLALAASPLDTSARLDSSSGNALLLEAMAALQEGAFESAASLAQQASVAMDYRGEPWSVLARALQANGRPTEAESAYVEALLRHERIGNFESFVKDALLLGKLRDQVGDLTDAQDVLTLAVERAATTSSFPDAVLALCTDFH